jgi:RNA polymerase sigma factor (sigma-70 family)
MLSKFHTTNWSLVEAAQGADNSRSRRALTELCEAYWQPLYAFIRRQGHGVEEARDLTQAFFAHLLEKDSLQTVTPEAGRFRSFLLASLKNLLTDEHRREVALKRGRNGPPISLDVASAESAFPNEPVDNRTPETVFEERWALTVLHRAVARVRKEFERQGKSERFERMRHNLLGERPAPRYEEIAADLGMTEDAVGVAVHRLRKRFGQALREEIGGTVAAPEEIDDEIRHLLTVLNSPGRPGA